MKKTVRKFCLILLILMGTVISCQQESLEQVKDLPVDGKQKNSSVVSIEQNGVGIEFCLLNEKGEPATVFNEGENFKFHLAITNNVKPDTSMFIVSDFLRNPCLFMVFSNTHDKIGKPVKWSGMYKCGDANNEVKQGETWYMEFSWNEPPGTEEVFIYNNLIRVFQHFFMGLNQPPLSKGYYYTEFTQQFCLRKFVPHPQVEFVCTDTLQLRINFEIK